MTQEVDPEQMAAIEAKLWEENKIALTKQTITLVGGAGHGSTFDVPNGVTELAVETAFGAHWYVRNPKNELEFIPRLDISDL